MNWLLFQLADSAYPSGGFAHSFGLEAALAGREVTCRDELDRFVRSVIWQTGASGLPFVGAAWDSPERLAELESLVEAMLTGHVANRASRAQGRALVGASARVFADVGAIRTLDTSVRGGELRAHVAPVVGVVMQALGLARSDALAWYLHTTLRGVLSAAVRLGVAGPHEAQRMQRALAPELDRALRTCESLEVHQATSTDPWLEILGNWHDRLTARLFQS